MSDLHDRYLSLLLDKISEPRYPSPPMMDRVERTVHDRDQLAAYVEVLLDKIEQDQYPSPSMLDRVARLLG